MDTATTASLIDPERQFVGCLLWLPHLQARRVLAGMRADDLADPMTAHVLQLVIEVVAAGHAPAPVTVYSHAVATGQAPGEHRRHRLARWLTDTYGATTAAPADLAYQLKTVVLEAAWRRALAEYATRLAHAADTASTDVLRELADDTERPDALWRRYQAACQPDTRLEVAA